MFNPVHPGELIRETIDGITEETGKKLSIEEVAISLGTTQNFISNYQWQTGGYARDGYQTGNRF